MAQSDENNKIDPQNHQAAREAVPRSDTFQSPAAPGGAPQIAEAAGMSGNLQTGGGKPAAGAGDHNNLQGNMRTPGGLGGEKA